MANSGVLPWLGKQKMAPGIISHRRCIMTVCQCYYYIHPSHAESVQLLRCTNYM